MIPHRIRMQMRHYRLMRRNPWYKEVLDNFHKDLDNVFKKQIENSFKKQIENSVKASNVQFSKNLSKVQVTSLDDSEWGINVRVEIANSIGVPPQFFNNPSTATGRNVCH